MSSGPPLRGRVYSARLCPVCYWGDPVVLFFFFPFFSLFPFFFLLHERNLCVLQQVNSWLFSLQIFDNNTAWRWWVLLYRCSTGEYFEGSFGVKFPFLLCGIQMNKHGMVKCTMKMQEIFPMLLNCRTKPWMTMG